MEQSSDSSLISNSLDHESDNDHNLINSNSETDMHGHLELSEPSTSVHQPDKQQSTTTQVN